MLWQMSYDSELELILKSHQFPGSSLFPPGSVLSAHLSLIFGLAKYMMMLHCLIT